MYLRYFSFLPTNLGYYLLVCPYKLHVDPATVEGAGGGACRIRITRSCLQQFACGLVTALAMLENLVRVWLVDWATYYDVERVGLAAGGSAVPVAAVTSSLLIALKIMKQVATPSLVVLTSYTFWCKQVELLRFQQRVAELQASVCAFTGNGKSASSGSRKVRVQMWVVLLVGIFCACNDQVEECAIKLKPVGGDDGEGDHPNVLALQQAFRVLHWALILPRYYARYWGLMVKLIFPLFFTRIVRDFTQLYREGAGGAVTGLHFVRVLAHYEALKSAVSALNAMYGHVVLFSFLVGFPNVAIWSGLIPFLVRGGGMSWWITLLMLSIYMVRSGGMWVMFVLAARGHANATEFYVWVALQVTRSHGHILPCGGSIATALNLDLTCNQLAIKSAGDLFSVTYGLLGTVIGLILTYTIITVQFQVPSSCVVV